MPGLSGAFIGSSLIELSELSFLSRFLVFDWLILTGFETAGLETILGLGSSVVEWSEFDSESDIFAPK